jgi:HAD superfamily hydrolase (TIGR01484 family)
MRYLALACDYDGTLAHDGRVDAATLAALERFVASGRKLLLVSGRELDDLRTTFDHLELFEWLVLENGAFLYQPGSRQERTRRGRPRRGPGGGERGRQPGCDQSSGRGALHGAG